MEWSMNLPWFFSLFSVLMYRFLSPLDSFCFDFPPHVFISTRNHELFYLLQNIRARGHPLERQRGSGARPCALALTTEACQDVCLSFLGCKSLHMYVFLRNTVQFSYLNCR